ncbi:MAG: hypothetical protein HY646_02555 [Acidobacteria bacterium]|nr:hypothetical protein [Acidobacteriota bacterium]
MAKSESGVMDDSEPRVDPVDRETAFTLLLEIDSRRAITFCLQNIDNRDATFVQLDGNVHSWSMRLEPCRRLLVESFWESLPDIVSYLATRYLSDREFSGFHWLPEGRTGKEEERLGLLMDSGEALYDLRLSGLALFEEYYPGRSFYRVNVGRIRDYYKESGGNRGSTDTPPVPGGGEPLSADKSGTPETARASPIPIDLSRPDTWRKTVEESTKARSELFDRLAAFAVGKRDLAGTVRQDAAEKTSEREKALSLLLKVDSQRAIDFYVQHVDDRDAILSARLKDGVPGSRETPCARLLAQNYWDSLARIAGHLAVKALSDGEVEQFAWLLRDVAGGGAEARLGLPAVENPKYHETRIAALRLFEKYHKEQSPYRENLRRILERLAQESDVDGGAGGHPPPDAGSAATTKEGGFEDSGDGGKGSGTLAQTVGPSAWSPGSGDISRVAAPDETGMTADRTRTGWEQTESGPTGDGGNSASTAPGPPVSPTARSPGSSGVHPPPREGNSSASPATSVSAIRRSVSTRTFSGCGDGWTILIVTGSGGLLIVSFLLRWLQR